MTSLLALFSFAVPWSLVRASALFVRNEFSFLSGAGPYVAWLLAHLVTLSPLLALFAFLSIRKVDSHITDFIAAHHLRFREKVRVFVALLAVPSAVIFAFSVALILADHSVNAMLADRLPLLPVLLDRAFEGRYNAGPAVRASLASLGLLVGALSSILLVRALRDRPSEEER